MSDIDKKLLEIQTTLVARKDLRNDFAKFNYRSLEGITEAVKPLLKEHGCVLVISDEMVEIGGRFYVKATAKITDIESSEAETATGWAREQQTKKGMDEAQITGSASSYARKYACNGLFAIDDTKDPDAGKPEDDPKVAAAAAKNTAKAAVGAESLRKGEAAVENKVPHTGKVASWIASGAKEILAGGSAAVYWSENKVQIKKDCGEDGAKEVYKMVIK